MACRPLLVWIHTQEGSRLCYSVPVCLFFDFQCSDSGLALTCNGVLQDSNISPNRKIYGRHFASENALLPQRSKRRGCDSSVADPFFIFSWLIKSLLSQQLSPSETSFNSTREWCDVCPTSTCATKPPSGWSAAHAANADIDRPYFSNNFAARCNCRMRFRSLVPIEPFLLCVGVAGTCRSMYCPWKGVNRDMSWVLCSWLFIASHINPANGTLMQTAGNEKNKNVVVIRLMWGFVSVGWARVCKLPSSWFVSWWGSRNDVSMLLSVASAAVCRPAHRHNPRTAASGASAASATRGGKGSELSPRQQNQTLGLQGRKKLAVYFKGCPATKACVSPLSCVGSFTYVHVHALI